MAEKYLEMEKIKVLIVGATGYLGKRLVQASLAIGHETYVLHREEIGVDIEKVQMLLGFKEQGAFLVPGSFNDHRSLVNAVKLVDVVICAISGVHIRSHHILLQLKLVDAIKEAGNIKVTLLIFKGRFLLCYGQFNLPTSGKFLTRIAVILVILY